MCPPQRQLANKLLPCWDRSYSQNTVSRIIYQIYLNLTKSSNERLAGTSGIHKTPFPGYSESWISCLLSSVLQHLLHQKFDAETSRLHKTRPKQVFRKPVMFLFENRCFQFHNALLRFSTFLAIDTVPKSTLSFSPVLV